MTILNGVHHGDMARFRRETGRDEVQHWGIDGHHEGGVFGPGPVSPRVPVPEEGPPTLHSWGSLEFVSLVLSARAAEANDFLFGHGGSNRPSPVQGVGTPCPQEIFGRVETNPLDRGCPSGENALSR